MYPQGEEIQRTTTESYKVEGRFELSEVHFAYGIFTFFDKVTCLCILWKPFKAIKKSHK